MTKALEAALTELSKVKDTFNEDDIERLFQRIYLETLAAWESEASVLLRKFEKVEEELNEVVYEVYGLNEADREVIEEFLRRF